MFRLTPTVKVILIVNFGILILTSFLNLPLNDIFGMRVVFSDDFAIYQPFTYMWLHAGFGHILGNMLAVFFFGPMLEQTWGSKRFLQFYLIVGVGAGVLFGVADFVEKYPLKKDTEAYVANPNADDFYNFILTHDVRSYGANDWFEGVYSFSERFSENSGSSSLKQQSVLYVKEIYHFRTDIPMVGASGAVFGILLAFAMMFPNTMIYIYMLFPVKAKYLVLFYGLYELYSEMNRVPGDNIAHLAHLGGMLVAFILLKVWDMNRTRLY
ncbi:MAG: rhomboid family intramembrane serine protease [Cytophagales bacterium]|nr:rhomboid family intramembrane serine protease [Cytophagales bacterium]